MKTLKSVASTAVLAAAALFTGAANATGDRYYPETPHNNVHVNNNTHINNHVNNHINNRNQTSSAAANAQQQQQQAQQQQQTANGGAGGQGGTGGQGGNGGNGYGGHATGGNGYGGNATGGQSTSNATSASNATGGQSNANATGGASNATGGSSNATGGSSTSGGNSFSNSNHFEAAKPMGHVGSVNIMPAANCGTGWAMNVSIPFFGVGGGKSDISQFCLSQQAAQTAINAGLVARDNGMVATGLASLRKLHVEFDDAARLVIANLKKPCAKAAASISAIMLTDDDLQCDEAYLKGTREFVQALETPVAVPAPMTVQFPDTMNVRVVNDTLKVEGTVDANVEGVVKTKEQYTPRKGPRQPMPVTIVGTPQVEVTKTPCVATCASPAPAPGR